MEEFYKEITNYFSENPYLVELSKVTVILILSFILYIITKKIVLRGVQKVVNRTKTKYDDILFNDKLLARISVVVPLLVINYSAKTLIYGTELLERLSAGFIGVFIILSINAFLNSVMHLTESMEKFKDKPVKGYIQVFKIILNILGGIIIVGLFADQSPWTLLSAVGALTAVIILVFRDTILSFVASIQISSYDLVKVGDWIEAPDFGADGDVVDIALHTIKVQNWDRTISVIPTYKIIENSFKNWRGMQEFGGRRIMRSIYIDQSTIKFVDEDLIKRFDKFQLIKEVVRNRKDEIDKYNKEKGFDTSESINGRRMTNIGIFQQYLKAYLKQRDDVHQNTIQMVRQLQPSDKGIGIEIYVFAKTTEWTVYESIQADIFDHILAIVPKFDLKIFQSPTGNDFANLKSESAEHAE